jgi:hypothetical protein
MWHTRPSFTKSNVFAFFGNSFTATPLCCIVLKPLQVGWKGQRCLSIAALLQRSTRSRAKPPFFFLVYILHRSHPSQGGRGCYLGGSTMGYLQIRFMTHNIQALQTLTCLFQIKAKCLYASCHLYPTNKHQTTFPVSSVKYHSSNYLSKPQISCYPLYIFCNLKS